MTRAHLQQSTAASTHTAQAFDAPRPTNVTALVSKGDSGQMSMAPPFDMTLVSMPENGSVVTDAFAKFVAALAPDASLALRSALDGTETDEGPILVLTSDPVVSLAWRINHGVAPDKAFAEWKDSANALLILQRRDRRRVVIVDKSILNPEMSLARDGLVTRLNKLLPNLVGNLQNLSLLEQRGEPPIPDDPDPEALVISISLLADQSVVDLIEELRAITFGSTEAHNTLQLAMLAWKNAGRNRARTNLLCQQLEFQSARAKLETQKLRAKVELLTKNLDLRIKENQDADNSREEERKSFALQLADRDRSLATTNEELRDAKSVVKQLKERTDLLSDNFGDQTKAIERAKTLWEGERKSFTRQIAERDRQIEAAQKQTADANTEVRRAQLKAGLLGENLVLQDKLRQEMAHELVELEKRFEELKNALVSAQAQAKRERERLIAEKAAVERRRAHAQSRIEALLGSRSWRATRPFRAVKDLSVQRQGKRSPST